MKKTYDSPSIKIELLDRFDLLTLSNENPFFENELPLVPFESSGFEG